MADKIFARFSELQELPDDNSLMISVRVKLLIKNMFANKEANWPKTQERNQAGPKTRAEVRE